MKSLQNSTIGPIFKEFNAGKYYSKLNFVFNVCLLSFECFTTGTDVQTWCSVYFSSITEKGTWINVHPWSLTCFGKPEDKDRRTQKILTQTHTNTNENKKLYEYVLTLNSKMVDTTRKGEATATARVHTNTMKYLEFWYIHLKYKYKYNFFYFYRGISKNILVSLKKWWVTKFWCLSCESD